MSYKIIVDSCGELPKSLKDDGRFMNVALGIQVDDHHIVDDETFDQADFLRRTAASPNCPKSSCPSPNEYMEAFKGEAEHVYAVTLSAELSGSYNSAALGKNLYDEKIGDKKVHIFNSKSASIGQTLIAMKIQELEEQGKSFEEVISGVDEFIAGQNTYFVLESLETLRKNGRLSNIKAFVASALRIKPVMGSTPEGTICQLDQARGINKALKKMIEYIVERTENPEGKILGISHCNCPERAEQVRKEILEKMKLKDIFVIETRGISSMYASDGGIIISV